MNAATPKVRHAKAGKAVKTPVAVPSNDRLLELFLSCWISHTLDPVLKDSRRFDLSELDSTNQGDGMSQRRAFMAADWLVRTVAPTWLEFQTPPQATVAAQLRALPRITSDDALDAAAPLLQAAAQGVQHAHRGVTFADVLEGPAVTNITSVLSTAIVSLVGEQGVYAAANIARGPGEAMEEGDLDFFVKPFPETIQSIVNIVQDIAHAELEGWLAGCLNQGDELAKITNKCRVAIAPIHEGLIGSAERLLEQMINGEGYDQPPRDSLSDLDLRIPADVLGEHTAPAEAAARSWRALHWLVSSALSDLIDQVPELQGHAAWLGSIGIVDLVDKPHAVHAGLQRVKRDAYSLLNAVTTPWLREEDLDGQDFIFNGPLSSDFYKLLSASLQACGVDLLAAEYARRASEFDRALDLYQWEKGIAHLQAGIVDEVNSVLCAALHVVMIRALVRPDGSLPDTVDRFGPAGSALLTVESSVRESYFYLHERLRSQGA